MGRDDFGLSNASRRPSGADGDRVTPLPGRVGPSELRRETWARQNRGGEGCASDYRTVALSSRGAVGRSRQFSRQLSHQHFSSARGPTTRTLMKIELSQSHGNHTGVGVRMKQVGDAFQGMMSMVFDDGSSFRSVLSWINSSANLKLSSRLERRRFPHGCLALPISLTHNNPRRFSTSE